MKEIRKSSWDVFDGDMGSLGVIFDELIKENEDLKKKNNTLQMQLSNKAHAPQSSAMESSSFGVKQGFSFADQFTFPKS